MTHETQKEKVYVISAGHYSAWEIKRIFKDKDKAYHYHSICNFHDLNDVEEYELSDEGFIEPIEYVHFRYMIKDIFNSISWSSPPKMFDYKIEIKKTNTFDNSFENMTKTTYMNGIIHLYRPLKNNKSSIEQLTEKCLKICKDLEAVIKYETQNDFDINNSYLLSYDTDSQFNTNDSVKIERFPRDLLYSFINNDLHEGYY